MAANITETKQNVLDTITGKTGKLPTRNGLYWAPTTDFLKETGPLTDLYRDKKYTYNSLSYPRDVGSEQKQHAVVFAAIPVELNPDPLGTVGTFIVDEYKKGMVVVDETAAKLKAAKEKVEGADGMWAGVTTAAELAGNAVVESMQSVISGGPAALEKTLRDSLKAIKPKYGDAKDTITLYMPDTAEFSQSAHYNQVGALEAAASVPYLGKVPSMVQSTLQNPAMRVALNSMGYVFNPQEQVLFEGIDFRTFSMSFTLTPYSKEESTQIKEIIKAFRKNSAPTIITKSLGFFFTPPCVFEIKFMYGNTENPNIPQLKRCVLTEVGVNYAPNGTWSTFDDGTPVQTTLTLNFKEIELIDSTAIEAGY
jgi:hypothetical protein